MEDKAEMRTQEIEQKKLLQLKVIADTIESKFNNKNIRREIAVKFMAAMLVNNSSGNYHDVARDAIDATEILLQKLTE